MHHCECQLARLLLPPRAVDGGVGGRVAGCGLQVNEGSALSAGALIAKLDLDDPTKVKRAEMYTGARLEGQGGWRSCTRVRFCACVWVAGISCGQALARLCHGSAVLLCCPTNRATNACLVLLSPPPAGQFPPLGPPQVHSDRVDHRFTSALTAAKMIMAGYNHPVEEILDELVGCLDSKALPLLQWKEELSFVESRLPAGGWGATANAQLWGLGKGRQVLLRWSARRCHGCCRRTRALPLAPDASLWPLTHRGCFPGRLPPPCCRRRPGRQAGGCDG